MFRSVVDHHRGAYLILVKILVKIRVFICGARGNAAAYTYMHLFYVLSGVERYAD
jgi:hypothetical protein